MTADQYWALKYYEQEKSKRPSERLSRANAMWDRGFILRDVMRETDLWTKLPEPLLYMRNGDDFYVDGERYRIDRFDFYDNMVVRDASGNESYHNIYGSRGDDFFMKVELDPPKKEPEKTERKVPDGPEER